MFPMRTLAHSDAVAIPVTDVTFPSRPYGQGHTSPFPHSTNGLVGNTPFNNFCNTKISLLLSRFLKKDKMPFIIRFASFHYTILRIQHVISPSLSMTGTVRYRQFSSSSRCCSIRQQDNSNLFRVMVSKLIPGKKLRANVISILSTTTPGTASPRCMARRVSAKSFAIFGLKTRLSALCCGTKTARWHRFSVRHSSMISAIVGSYLHRLSKRMMSS